MSEKNTAHTWGKIAKFPVVVASIGLVAGMGLPVSPAAAEEIVSDNATVIDATPVVADDTVITPDVAAASATGAGSFKVTMGKAKAGKSLPVTVTLKSGKGGVNVTLERDREGADQVIATKMTSAKGVVNFTIPGKMVTRAPQAFTVDAPGATSTTFVVQAVRATLGAVPGTVSGFKATPYSRQVDLAWSARSGATSYLVQYQPQGAGDEWESVTTTTLTYSVKNLTDGSPYGFRVAAANADGTGVFTSILTETPQSNPPAAVTNLTATPTDSTVALKWTAAARATGYDVERTCVDNTNFDPTVCFVNKQTVKSTSATWGGLENGTTYLFGVTATGVDGPGPRTTIESTPQAKPTTPTNLSVQAGNQSAYLTWSAVPGAVDYRSYQKSATGAAVYGDWTEALSTRVNGLTNGEAYTIGIQARNAFGSSALLTDTGITPTADAPGEVGSVAAVPADGGATLTWTPAAGATDYVVVYKPVNSDAAPQSVTPDKNVSAANNYFTMVIPGLVNGTVYEFAVYGENDYGRGPADTVRATPAAVNLSADRSDASVAAVPGAPTSLNVQTRDGALYATWGAAANVPTQYLIYYSPDAQDWTLFETNPASDRNSLIQPLTNGQRYWVQVVAVNGDGVSAPAAAGPFTPAPRPDVPKNVRAFASNDALQVNWSPTPFATRYLVRWRLFGTSTYSPVLYVEGTSYRITGLQNDKDYEIFVASNNTTGTSSGNTIGPISPTDLVPDAVTDITGKVGNQEVTLTWTAPADASGYKVVTSLADTNSVVGKVNIPRIRTIKATGSTTIEHTVPNLSNGVDYLFTVYSTNQYGWSGPAVAGPFKPEGQIVAPDAPTITSVTPGDTIATINYRLNAAGSAPLARVQYSMDNGAEGSWKDTDFDSPHLETGLTNGQTYQVVMRVIDQDGSVSPVSNMVTVTPLGVPAKPTIDEIISGDGQLTVDFTAPSDAAAPVEKIYYSTDNGATFKEETDKTSPIVITGLTNGKTYQVVVRAANRVGGRNSDAVPATPEAPIAPPGKPNILSVEPTADGVLTVEYIAPELTASQPVDKVEYRTRPEGGTWTDWTTLPNTTAPFTVMGANGKAIDIQIKAVNTAGSTDSDPSSGTPIGLPDKPAISSVVAGDKELTVNFNAPASPANPVDKIFYSINGGTTFTEHTTRTSPLVIDNLVNGTTYSVVVRSNNELGFRDSDAVDGTPIEPILVPAAPTINKVTPTAEGTLTVEFDAPSTTAAPVDTVEYRTQPAGGAWSDWTAAASTTAPFTVTGALGVTLDVQVRSVNAVGSTESNTMSGTPMGAPSKPTITKVEDYSNQFVVTFDPNSSVDRPVNSAQYRIDGGQWQAISPEGAVAFPVSSGIENGKTYTVEVRTTNAIGSTVSEPAEGRPFTRPDAPTILKVTRGDASAVIDYQLNFDGGREVTSVRYTYKWTNEQGVEQTGFRTHQGTSGVYNLNGLTNGVTYTITMAAWNEARTWSPESNAVTVTPFGAPAQPTIDSVITGDKELRIEFTAPTSAANPVDDVYYTVDNGAAVRVANKDAGEFTIEGLNNNQTYSIVVISRNGMGDALSLPATGTPRPSATAPAAPTLDSAAPGNNKAYITFTLNGDGGSAITSLEWRATNPQPGETKTGTILPDGTGNFPTNYTIEGLTNNLDYDVDIRAINAIGPSPWSNSITVTPPGGEWRDAIFVPERWYCDNGGTLDGQECVTQEPVPGYYVCPVDASNPWTLNGDKCTRSVWVPESGYWSCPNGGTWNGSQCVATKSPDTTWSCPLGGTWDGTQCVVSTPADPIYSCDGYPAAGRIGPKNGMCYWDTWVCPSGWNRVDDSLCWRTASGTGPVGTTCSALRAQYNDPPGWSGSWNANTQRCTFSYTDYAYNADKVQRQGAAAIVGYSCATGTLSGNQCVGKYPGTPTQTCSAPYDLVSGTCVWRYAGTWVPIPGYWTTQTINATWVPPTTREVRTPAKYEPARYECEPGGILDGTRCFYPNVDQKGKATSGTAASVASSNGTLAAPVVTWERNATTANSVTFTWKAAEGADNYLCNGRALGLATTCTVTAKPDTVVSVTVKACVDNTCSPAGVARGATNPVVTENVRIGKVTQVVPGGPRCANLIWSDVTVEDRYRVTVERDGTFASQQHAYAPTAQVCNLNARGEYTFIVTPVNRLDHASMVETDDALLGAGSAKATLRPVPTKPGTPKAVANKTKAGAFATSITASVAGGLPAGATHTVFQVVDQPNRAKVAGTTAKISGLPFGTRLQVTASFCNADGCSAPSKPSKAVTTSPRPAGR